MDAKHFDAWTRRRFGLAAGSALAALLGLRNADDAGARRRRCLRQGRACTFDGKRCCGKLTCENTFVEGDWFDVCCKPDGESCTADSICCLTNCDAETGKCKTCQGQVCVGPGDCCPYVPDCDQGFCGGCATEGQGCHTDRPCCPGEGECTNGFCGGCIRSPDEGVTQCVSGGVPCCDTQCTIYAPGSGSGFCVSEKDGPCARDLDCRTCWDNFDSVPSPCPGACDADGKCTV
jgi:hypothetical protein